MLQTFVHPMAIVETRRIGEGTRIWAFTHVMRDVSVGANCNIGEHCFIEAGVTIGDDVTIKNGTMVWEGVRLGSGVFVGPGVIFTNDRYPRSARLSYARRRYVDRQWLETTTIGEGASLGAGAVILAGIAIGEFCMVGAGSIVTRTVPPYALAVGSPARIRGWVCQCGRPLPIATGAATCAVTCAACGVAFIHVDGVVRRLAEAAGATATAASAEDDAVR